jgi:hypothetical protein
MLFAAQFAMLDWAFRASAYHDGPRALLGAGASVAVGLLAYAAARRRAWRVPIALFAGATLVTQAICFAYYRAPLDAQVLASAIHSWVDVRRAVVPNLPRALALVAMASVVEYALLSLARLQIPGRVRIGAAIAALVLVLVGPRPADGTPEMRLADAARAFASRREPPIEGAVSLPALPSRRAELPSVLLVVTESVRATEYCSGHGEKCETSPEIDRLLPNRVPLRQMRAISSYTAIAVGALLTGRTQDGSRQELASMPNVFDWARAVRLRGGRPRAIYWSAQSESIFERAHPRTMADEFVTLETLTGRTFDEDPVDTGFDRLLSAHVDRAMPALRGPAFVVLHFFSTHAPYFVEPSDAPFSPWSNVVTWSGMPALLNAYKNSIHEQDKLVARAVRQFIQSQAGRPWVVVFTSDHGEAFADHGAIHHGQNLYDEQIHVPAWVAWGNGALTPEEEKNVAAWSDAFATHLDLAPTLLDVWGVLDSLPMRTLRDSLEGRSLLRPVVPMKKALPITNCTNMFPCPVNAWGVLRDRYELHAQVWDPEWQCVDLGGDRADDRECERLRAISRAYYPTLPNRKPNR